MVCGAGCQTCGPIVDRPGAGPEKLFRRGDKACVHRIHLDVMSDFPEFGVIANQPVVAFILPEWLPGSTQHAVALCSGESLERLRELRNRNQWRDQEMNVIGHHNVRVELVLL